MRDLELRGAVVNKGKLMKDLEKEMNSELEHMVHTQNKKVNDAMDGMKISVSSRPIIAYHYDKVRDIKFYSNGGYKIRVFLDNNDIIDQLEDINKKILKRSIIYMVDNYSTQGITFKVSNTEVEFSKYPKIKYKGR